MTGRQIVAQLPAMSDDWLSDLGTGRIPEDRIVDGHLQIPRALYGDTVDAVIVGRGATTHRQAQARMRRAVRDYRGAAWEQQSSTSARRAGITATSTGSGAAGSA